MLCDYLQLEKNSGQRLICENDAFAAFVPFWAVWPFETLVISKRHLESMSDFNANERDLLGDILKKADHPLRQLVRSLIPLLDGISSTPTDGEPHPGVALPRALLSAAAAFGYHSKVHGRIRNAGNSPARHHSRSRC